VAQQATHVSKCATGQLLLQARVSGQLLLLLLLLLGAALQLTAVQVTGRNTQSAV
jgi:hypothetical protein